MRTAIKRVAAKQLIVTEENRSILEPCNEYYIFKHIVDDVMYREALGGVEGVGSIKTME